MRPEDPFFAFRAMVVRIKERRGEEKGKGSRFDLFKYVIDGSMGQVFCSAVPVPNHNVAVREGLLDHKRRVVSDACLGESKSSLLRWRNTPNAAM